MNAVPSAPPVPVVPASSGPQKVYEAKGTHVLADLQGADPLLLADGTFLQRVASEAARLAGATVLFAHTHGFGEGQGVAGVVLLAESHLTFHTWPEHGAAALDAFMCGDCQPQLAMEHLVKALGAKGVRYRCIDRGEVSVLSKDRGKKQPLSTPIGDEALSCPFCAAPLPWSATEAFPAVPSADWREEGDCEECCAQIEFSFDSNGARVLRVMGFK